MNFDLSDEQRQLNETTRRFVQERYGFAQRKRSVAGKGGFSPEIWRAFAELGWLGVPLPENAGGLGGGPVELMILMESLGRGAVVEPYLANVVLAGGMLAGAGSVSADGIVPKMIAGETQLALAYAEPQGRFDLRDVTTRARATADGWRLDGKKSMVLNAGAADEFLVVARTAGEHRDQSGISVFMVSAAASGVNICPYRNHDGAASGDVLFDGVCVGAAALIGSQDGALPALQAVIDTAAVAECASAIGAMDVLINSTADYLNTRVQFGRPLAGFQVLQHRLVDMHVALEEMRSLVIAATLTLEGGSTIERQRAVSAAKIHLAEAGRKIGEEAVQMHGGIGMTDEFPIGHFYKRLLAAGTLFGNGDYHLGRYAELLLASG